MVVMEVMMSMRVMRGRIAERRVSGRRMVSCRSGVDVRRSRPHQRVISVRYEPRLGLRAGKVVSGADGPARVVCRGHEPGRRHAVVEPIAELVSGGVV